MAKSFTENMGMPENSGMCQLILMEFPAGAETMVALRHMHRELR